MLIVFTSEESIRVGYEMSIVVSTILKFSREREKNKATVRDRKGDCVCERERVCERVCVLGRERG